MENPLSPLYLGLYTIVGGIVANSMISKYLSTRRQRNLDRMARESSPEFQKYLDKHIGTLEAEFQTIMGRNPNRPEIRSLRGFQNYKWLLAKALDQKQIQIEQGQIQKI